MPYALIPDGYSLKKVTKLQKEAVNAKRRHDDVVALFNNPNTPIVAAGAALALATPLIIDLVLKRIEDLELPGVQLPSVEDLPGVKVALQKDLTPDIIDTLINQSGLLSFIGLTPEERKRKKVGEALAEELGLA